MSLTDALVVTALGMGVVFIGLILTALLITSFGFVARLRERRAAAASLLPADSVVASVDRPVDVKVLAVIATVLEIERRLHRAESTGRLTIVRGGERWRTR